MSDLQKTRDEDFKRIQEALDLLVEHYDVVHIFANRHEHGEFQGTIRVDRGTGNWYSRYGQIKEWINYEEECNKIKARKDQEL